MSHSEFNLDKNLASSSLLDHLKSLRLNNGAADSVTVGPNKYLSVPKAGAKPLNPDDIAVCADSIKRYQPKALTQYDRNMFIVNWLDNIDPQNCITPEDP